MASRKQQLHNRISNQLANHLNREIQVTGELQYHGERIRVWKRISAYAEKLQDHYQNSKNGHIMRDAQPTPSELLLLP